VVNCSRLNTGPFSGCPLPVHSKSDALSSLRRSDNGGYTHFCSHSVYTLPRWLQTQDKGGVRRSLGWTCNVLQGHHRGPCPGVLSLVQSHTSVHRNWERHCRHQSMHLFPSPVPQVVSSGPQDPRRRPPPGEHHTTVLCPVCGKLKAFVIIYKTICSCV